MRACGPLKGLRPELVFVACTIALGACSGSDVDPQRASAHVSAAAGGRVATPDGALTIVVPPGALATDTTISIRALSRDEWPAELSGRSVIGEAYALEPDGLTFATAVTLVERWETLPASLGTRADGLALPAHFMLGATVEPAASHTWYHADGRVTLVARVPHFSIHWSEDHLAPGVRVSTRIDAEAGTHRVGETWHARRVTFLASAPVELRAPQTSNVVVHAPGAAAYTEPVQSPGWLRTSSADGGPLDDDGYHNPYEIFLDDDREQPSWVRMASPRGATTPIAPITPLVVAEPLPGWRCTAQGEQTDALWVGAYTTVRLPGGTVDLPIGASHDLGPVTCELPPAAWSSALLADVRPMRLSGDELVPTAPPETVVHLLDAADSVLARVSAAGPHTVVYHGVEVQNRDGAPQTITITSDTQALTASLGDPTYSLAGADTDKPAFGSGATVTFTAGDTSVAVPAPGDGDVRITPAAPGGSAADVLVRVPADADGLYIHGTLIGSTLAGESGYRGFIPLGDAPIADGHRETSPFFAELIRVLDERALAFVGDVYLGPANRAESASFWGSGGDPAPFYVARVVKVPMVQLVPPPPVADPGVVPCDDLPADFPRPAGDTRLATVCVDGNDGCDVVADSYEEDPPATTSCYGDDRVVDVRILASGEPRACIAGPGWTLIWSSSGAHNGCTREVVRGQEAWIIAERRADGVRRRVRFTVAVDQDAVEVLAVDDGTGQAFHPFGAHAHCEAFPAVFGPPADADNAPYAALCVGSAASPACSAFGDTSLSQEDEGAQGCDVRHALELWVTTPNGAYAYTGPGHVWTFESKSHGELIGDNLVKALPADTEVTVVVTKDGDRWRVVFTRGSAGYRLVAATRL